MNEIRNLTSLLALMMVALTTGYAEDKTPAAASPAEAAKSTPAKTAEPVKPPGEA